VNAVIESFLRAVARHNETKNVIHHRGAVHCLVHSFWDHGEIEHAMDEALRADWQLPRQFVPFYGDWHTLMCVDQQDGSVVELDDDRRILRRWPDTARFEAALAWDDAQG